MLIYLTIVGLAYIARDHSSRLYRSRPQVALCIARDRWWRLSRSRLLVRLYRSQSLVTLVTLAIAGRTYIARDHW